MLIKEPEKRSQASRARYENIPESLVYEVIDGEPLYYKGYKDVLSNKKSLDDIMGSSGLQSFIIQYILEILYIKVGRKLYHFLTNEVGTHLNKNDNLSGDIFVYEKSKLVPAKINEKYISIPAKIAVEIDAKIDISKDSDLNYVNIKTQKLLNFGVEKVIWIFTGSQKVMVSQQNHDWLTKDWNQDIELLDGHYFNIGQYLKDEGVKVETNF